MLKLMRKLLSALALVAIGCGGTTNDNPGAAGYVATAHVITAAQTEQIPTNRQVAIGPFSVPSGAVVDFTIADAPIGVGFDTMDVGIVTDASVDSTAPVGYGIKENVSSTSGETQPLPAGAYDLLVQCANFVDDCRFQAGIVATY